MSIRLTAKYVLSSLSTRSCSSISRFQECLWLEQSYHLLRSKDLITFSREFFNYAIYVSEIAKSDIDDELIKRLNDSLRDYRTQTTSRSYQSGRSEQDCGVLQRAFYQQGYVFTHFISKHGSDPVSGHLMPIRKELMSNLGRGESFSYLSEWQSQFLCEKSARQKE